MSCGAVVMIRLTDIDTGELVERAQGDTLEHCLRAPVSEDICALRGLEMEMQLFGMPARNVRVEVAMWNPDDLTHLPSGTCPAAKPELFDFTGKPRSNYDPRPAFAGAAYFRVGTVDNITVPLQCPGPELLDSRDCAANFPTDVFATVTDMSSMQELRKEQAPSVDISVGVAKTVADNQGGSISKLESADLFKLSLDNSGERPVYQQEIQQRFGERVCSTSLEGTAQATVTAYCEEVQDQAEELRLSPILVPKAIVDAALAALGLTAFPQEGLLIGRVVDVSSSPTSGVVVTPTTGSVLYLNSDLSGIESAALSSNSAYFVSTDVPYDAEWTASHFDGRRQSFSPRGGLIEGKVSAIIIRLTEGVIPE